MASHLLARQDAWNFFYNLFDGNEYAAAGACGNMQWESGLYSDNAENEWNRQTGLSDEWLTNEINSGNMTLSTFLQRSWWVNPYGFGYGLSQWTTTERRTLLWSRTIDLGIDIDDINAQLDYITWEFTLGRWAGVRRALMLTTNVHDATYIYCRQYEGGGWSDTRETYANSFYTDFAGTPTGYAIRIHTQGNGYADASVHELIASYAQAGDLVTIYAQAGEGDYFTVWTVDSGGVTLSDYTNTTANFTMPVNAVDITAHFTGSSPQPPPYPPTPPTPTLNPVQHRMPIWMYPIFRG